MFAARGGFEFVTTAITSTYWMGVLYTSGKTSVGNGVTIDASGNMYVVGETNPTSSYESLSKYNASGVLQWQVQLGDGTNGVYGTSISLDSSGNIYASGYATLTGTYTLISKYNTSGTLQWQRTFGTINKTFRGWGISVNGSSVYIGGSNNTSGVTDIQIVKYNTSGAIQWQNRLYDTLSGTAYATAADASNQYITGSYSSNLMLSKFNAAGTLQWQKFLAAPGGASRGLSIAIDSSGNSHIVGYSGAGINSFIVITKYNTSGTIQWQRKLSSGTVGVQGQGCAIDSSGNVYACGFITDTSGSPVSMLITKYNTSGTIQWQRSITGSTTPIAYSISVDPTGTDMYITGLSSSRIFVAKLPADGSKTGTYSVAGISYVYAASSLTAATATLTSAAVTLATIATTGSNAASTLTSTTSTMTSTVVTI